MPTRGVSTNERMRVCALRHSVVCFVGRVNAKKPGSDWRTTCATRLETANPCTAPKARGCAPSCKPLCDRLQATLDYRIERCPVCMRVAQPSGPSPSAPLQRTSRPTKLQGQAESASKTLVQSSILLDSYGPQASLPSLSYSSLRGIDLDQPLTRRLDGTATRLISRGVASGSILGLFAGFIASKIKESRAQGSFINILSESTVTMVGSWLFDRFG